MARPPMTTPEDFWARVDTSGDGCWLWGKTYTGNYQSAFYAGRYHVAHRLAYMLNGGRLTRNLDVHHLCENPQCVRPDHLQALTRSAHKLQHPPSRHWRFALRRPATATTPEHCIVSHEFTQKGPAAMAGRTLQRAYPGYRLEIYRTDAKGERLKVRDLPPAA